MTAGTRNDRPMGGSERAWSLVIEVIPEPGRTPHPAFPQSISLCSCFAVTTERFYAEASLPGRRPQQRQRDDRDRRGVPPTTTAGDHDTAGHERGRVVEAPSHDRRRRERVGRRDDRPRTKATPTAARHERVTGPGDRAHRREHQPNCVEGKRAGSSGCESWSEVRVQGPHLPAGASK